MSLNLFSARYSLDVYRTIPPSCMPRSYSRFHFKEDSTELVIQISEESRPNLQFMVQTSVVDNGPAWLTVAGRWVTVVDCGRLWSDGGRLWSTVANRGQVRPSRFIANCDQIGGGWWL